MICVYCVFGRLSGPVVNILGSLSGYISGYVSSCVFGSLSGPLADIFGSLLGYISGYVSSCVFGSLSGPLADIFGRKRMALVSKDLFFQITEKYLKIKTSYDNNNNFLFFMYSTNIFVF